MTKKELQTIRNIIARLNKQNCGCALSEHEAKVVASLNRPGETFDPKIQGVSRIYLDTWVVGALKCLLPESHDPDLAERLSS